MTDDQKPEARLLWDADNIRRLEDLLRFRDDIAGLPKLSERVDGVEKAYSGLTRRVDMMSLTEEHLKDMDAVRQGHIDRQFAEIKEQLKCFQQRVERVAFWALAVIGTGVLAAAIRFVIAGGLA